MHDTIQALDQQERVYFGYGRTLPEARKLLLIEKGGIRLGFLGYSCLSTNGENHATTMSPGVCPLAIDYLRTDISRLKNKVDHIFVVLHWGEEGVGSVHDATIIKAMREDHIRISPPCGRRTSNRSQNAEDETKYAGSQAPLASERSCLYLSWELSQCCSSQSVPSLALREVAILCSIACQMTSTNPATKWLIIN